MRLRVLPLIIGLLIFLVSRPLFGQLFSNRTDVKNDKAYTLLNIPQLQPNKKPRFTIAIIDDGFNLQHQSLKGLIATNKREVAGDLKDNEKNGYIDDLLGWDVSDHDNSPAITP